MMFPRYMDVIVDSVTAYKSVHGGAYNKEATGYQQDIPIVEDAYFLKRLKGLHLSKKMADDDDTKSSSLVKGDVKTT